LRLDPVHLDHAVVPAHLVRAQIDFEDADARDVERQLQASGYLREAFLGLLALGDVGVGAGDAARFTIRPVFDDGAAAFDPDPVPVPVPFAVAEDIERGFAAFLFGDLGKHPRPVVRVHGADPDIKRGLDRVVRPQATDGAPLAGIEQVATREVVIPDALAGGLERMVPAALPLGKLKRIAFALVDI